MKRTGWILGWILLCGLLSHGVQAQTKKKTDKKQTDENVALKQWEVFDFRAKAITADDLKDLDLTQLKYMRGIVFGKHGRAFDEDVIQKWLLTRPWYHPNPKYKVTDLNDNERTDMDAIKEAEHRKHDHVEPGDLKFYRDKEITKEEFGDHSRIEWVIMAAEVEAIHGKSFADQPWLQQFFEERYWYHPTSSYKPSLLNEFERKNLATISKLAKEERKVALAPGDMALFQESPITPDLLKGLSLWELRVLRNEVYARHGKRFHTEWIQQYFADEDWYKPLPDYSNPKLSTIEIKNINTIVATERQIHTDLAVKPIDPALLEDMFLEDAKKLRYEILARHGKKFSDPWLDSYFRSFDWYKPDPNFKQTSLNAVERKNVSIILAFEKKATKEANSTAA